MAAHRYWRFLFSAAGSGDFAVVGEAELRAAFGGADQTGSGTASADSEYPSWVVANAFANNGVNYSASGCWSSASGFPHWLQYDFGSGQDKSIVEYTLQSHDHESYQNESPAAWQFQYSDNAADWTTVDTQSGISWTASEVKTFSFGATTAVQQDVALRWNTLAAVQQDVTPRWNALAAVQQDVALRWNALAAVQQDVALRWDILAAVTAQQDVTLRWNTLAAVQQDVAVRWNVLTAAQQDVILRWLMDEAIPQLIPLADRLWVIAEDRTLTALVEDRVLTVMVEDRVLTVH